MWDYRPDSLETSRGAHPQAGEQASSNPTIKWVLYSPLVVYQILSLTALVNRKPLLLGRRHLVHARESNWETPKSLIELRFEPENSGFIVE